MPVTRKGKLNGIEARLENATKLGLLEWGMVLAQDAQGKAPVDTGRLKRSITNTVPVQVALAFWKALVGSNVEYAHKQEILQPYLRPALKETAKTGVKILMKNIMAALKNG